MNSNLGKEKLVPAKEAFESTKEPQLRSVIAEINNARKNGRCSTIIMGEKFHKETIEAVLEAGYDVCTNDTGDICFNHIFWDEAASGKIRETKA